MVVHIIMLFRNQEFVSMLRVVLFFLSQGNTLNNLGRSQQNDITYQKQGLQAIKKDLPAIGYGKKSSMPTLS